MQDGTFARKMLNVVNWLAQVPASPCRKIILTAATPRKPNCLKDFAILIKDRDRIHKALILDRIFPVFWLTTKFVPVVNNFS